MIELSGVNKDYGRFRAVSDVTLSIRPGLVTGLLGPNGAGKSTLIRMMTGLLTPTTGSITICGHNILTASGPAHGCIGYLPEFAPLYPEMTPVSYLHFRAGLFGLRGGRAKAAVDAAIARCWLAEMRNRRIEALSKGYKQRVGLAGAILHEPKVIILDEPTTGLDPTQIKQTRQLLRDLAKDRVLLLSSHILPEVEATCDRIIIIARGKVRADGSPAELERSLASSGGVAYTVSCAPGCSSETLAAFRAALAGLIGVDRIDTTPGGLRVMPIAGAGDLRESIARLAMSMRVVLVELHREEATLEQVFMRVIQSDEPKEAA